MKLLIRIYSTHRGHYGTPRIHRELQAQGTLCGVTGGVGNVWNEPHEETLFKGYARTDIDMAILSYYRHERIVEDIATYAQNLLLDTDGSIDKLKMYQHFLNIFEPNGVVDIAFKTDKI